MEETIVQSKKTTYEDLVTEVMLLTEKLPVGSHWFDDRHTYKVDSIALTSGLAKATCTRISIQTPIASGSEFSNSYDYQILPDSFLTVSNISNLHETTESNYEIAKERVMETFKEKNGELFQKQCLLKMPTEEPFTDFDTLHDEIVTLKDNQHFFYEPTDNCFRVFRINMDEYAEHATPPDGWHFYMNKDNENVHVLSIPPRGIGNTLGEIINRHNVYPITEYQFTELVSFIENDPNKSS